MAKSFVAVEARLAARAGRDNRGAVPAMPGFVPEPLVRSHPFAYAQPVGSRMGNSKKPKTHVDLGQLPGLIGYVLRRAQLAVFQDFFAAFAPHNIRPAQFSVLTVIDRNPGLTQSQVAGAL